VDEGGRFRKGVPSDRAVAIAKVRGGVGGVGGGWFLGRVVNVCICML